MLAADLIVNLPKMKTHQKAGVTGALKNLVGCNGEKAFLVHYLKGRPCDGGDEFPPDVPWAVRLQVLGRAGRYRRVRDGEDGLDPLDVKEVWHEERRYIVCRNPAQAERDRLAREQIVAALREKLHTGEKTMLGNKGFLKPLLLLRLAGLLPQARLFFSP